jgi:hypothetical protein
MKMANTLMSFLLAVAFVASTVSVPAQASAEHTPRFLVHLLDYLAKDYGGAVANGKITSQGEYDEQIAAVQEALLGFFVGFAVKDGAVQESDKVATLRAVDVVLGLNLAQGTSTQSLSRSADELSVPEEVSRLLAARKAAREAKEWKESDRIRDELKQHGFTVVDTPEGTQELMKIR